MLVPLLLLIVCGVITGQYPIGEPMAEPEPEPRDVELIDAAVNVIDAMNRGGFVAAAMSLPTDATRNHTHRNVTYPIYGSGSEYFVDVTFVTLSTSADRGREVYLGIQDKVVIVLDNALATEPKHDNFTVNRLIAVSELYSKRSQILSEIDVHGEEEVVGDNDCKPQFGDKYHHIIPGKVDALSVHTCTTVTNGTGDNLPLHRIVSQTYNGTVEYTTNLRGRYVPIMKAVAANSAGISGWYWRCGRWDTSHRRWDTGNCRVIPTRGETSSVTCRCVPNPQIKESATYTLILDIMRHSGVTNDVLAICISFEAISVVSLLVALIILLSLRGSLRASADNNKSSTTTIHINLCAALVLLHVVVLLRPLAVIYDLPCEVIAVLTHYFLLVSGAWMLVEGVTLYRVTCGNDFYSGEKRWIKCTVQCIFAWLFPCVIVGLCAGLGFRSKAYMDQSGGHRFMTNLQRMLNPSESELTDNFTPRFSKYSICWLNPTMTYAAAVPIALMLFPNVIIAIIVCARVWRIKLVEHRQNVRLHKTPSCGDNGITTVSSNVSSLSTTVKRTQPIIASLRAFLILLPVLGVPWIGTFVGVVPAAESTVTALHLLASSMQGVLVAFILCFLNRDVRRILRRRLQSRCSCCISNKVTFVTSLTKT